MKYGKNIEVKIETQHFQCALIVSYNERVYLVSEMLLLSLRRITMRTYT